MRDDWACCITLGGHEYVAETDLRRLGLHPYLPQYREIWRPRGETKPLIRLRPLFPKYMFIPVVEARSREMHFARGLCGHKHLVASPGGKLWTAPADVVFEVAKLENEGAYDQTEVGLGQRVKLRGTSPLSSFDMLVAHATPRVVELLAPLFGGVRATVRLGDLTRAA